MKRNTQTRLSKTRRPRASSSTARATPLGRYIVADPEICRGKPTFCGTRIMVCQVLKMVAEGKVWETIMEEWGGSITKEAIAEAIQLASDSVDIL